jgi:hypothetical protein
VLLRHVLIALLDTCYLDNLPQLDCNEWAASYNRVFGEPARLLTSSTMAGDCKEGARATNVNVHQLESR